MYVQEKFKESRTEILHALIRAHPLGALVVVGRNGLEINHMPFFLETACGEFGVLRAHIPKGNPLWQDWCNPDVEAVVIFQGEESYITPSWYPTKHAHGQAVPTWNYVVVHAHGQPVFITEREWLRAHVTELTNMQEAAMALPWQVSDAPEDYINKMLDSIVGVEIRVSKLLGKWKVSQNRPDADRRGVAAGLSGQQTQKAAAMEAQVLNALEQK